MSNRSRGLAVSCMIVQLAMCDKVLAEEPAKGGYRELRGGVPAEAQIELAKVGTPIWYTVNTKEGSTLRQVVAEVCGQQPAEVLDALLTEGVRLNLLKGPDDVIEKDVAVAVPFCLKVEQNVSVEIKSGDTLEKILNENYGVSGPKTLNKVYKANKAEFDAKNFTEFASKLPVGRQILVPMAEPRVFSARPDSGVSFESVLAGGEISASVRSQVESASVPVDQPPDPGAPKFDTIESVEFESTGASCAPPGQVASVVDLDLLRERFAVEEQAKKDFDGQDAQSVIVGIIDSGSPSPGTVSSSQNTSRQIQASFRRTLAKMTMGMATGTMCMASISTRAAGAAVKSVRTQQAGPYDLTERRWPLSFLEVLRSCRDGATLAPAPQFD